MKESKKKTIHDQFKEEINCYKFKYRDNEIGKAFITDFDGTVHPEVLAE